METRLLELDLQMFADGAEAGTQAGNAEQGGETTPSFDDVLKDKAMQAEFDRRVTKALNTAKEGWQKDAEERLAAAKTEAERLAKMTAEQKAEHERKQKENELADREAKLAYRELKAEAQTQLSEKGLPAGLIAGVNMTNADECKKSIEAIEAAFRAAVQEGVEERLKGKTQPKTGTALFEEAAFEQQMRRAMGLK